MKPPRILLADSDGEYLVGFAKTRLAILTSQREQAGLDILKERQYVDDYIIIIRSREDDDEILIIKNETSGNFLCHPRSGEFTIVQLRNAAGEVVRNLKIVDGNGTNPKGEALSGKYAFPLIDNDAGTKLLTRDEKGEWSVDNNPPENYGNLDWKDGEGTVLTFRGPASRYFPHDTSIVPGFTFMEESLGISGAEDTYTVFSPYVYEKGEVIAIAPKSYPSGGTFDKALVQGCAYINGVLVIMANVNYRNQGSHTKGFFHTLYVQGGDNEGWEQIWEMNLGRASVPWFFSPDGTKAVSVFDNKVHKIAITVTQGDYGTSYDVAYTTEDTGTISIPGNSTTGGQRYAPPNPSFDTSSGYAANENLGAKDGSDESYTYKATYTGQKIIAADYKGNELVTKSVKISGNEESTFYAKKIYTWGKVARLNEVEWVELCTDNIKPWLKIEGGSGNGKLIIFTLWDLCNVSEVKSDNSCHVVNYVPGAASGVINWDYDKCPTLVPLCDTNICSNCGEDPTGCIASIDVPQIPGNIIRTQSILTNCPRVTLTAIGDYYGAVTLGNLQESKTILGLGLTKIDGETLPISLTTQFAAVNALGTVSFSVDKGAIDSSTGQITSTTGMCGIVSVTVQDGCGRIVTKQYRGTTGHWCQTITYHKTYCGPGCQNFDVTGPISPDVYLCSGPAGASWNSTTVYGPGGTTYTYETYAWISVPQTPGCGPDTGPHRTCSTGTIVTTSNYASVSAEWMCDCTGCSHLISDGCSPDRDCL